MYKFNILKKFREDIQKAKGTQELIDACFENASGEKAYKNKLFFEKRMDALSKQFNKRHQLVSGQDGKPIAMAIKKKDNKPAMAVEFPEELEDLRRMLLDINNIAVLSIGASLCGSDFKTNFFDILPMAKARGFLGLKQQAPDLSLVLPRLTPGKMPLPLKY